jgi:toxin ParE1/3/4
MKRHKVSFGRRAQRDLFGLYRYIAAEAGHQVAGQYVARIEAACLELEVFPARGRRRDEMRSGFRTMGFERRATILFRVLRTEVVIVRIFYGGQDFERALHRDNDD